jgi:hypothetical protein
MKLPHGIVGIADVADPKWPLVKVKDFKAACYQVSRDVDAKVTEVRPNSALPVVNFHTGVLTLREKVTFVLCNTIHPYLGFTRADPRTHLTQEFIDHPVYYDAFGAHGFRPLDAAVLNSRVSEHDLESLGPHERKSIEYFAPSCLGYLIFNHWD